MSSISSGNSNMRPINVNEAKKNQQAAQAPEKPPEATKEPKLKEDSVKVDGKASSKIDPVSFEMDIEKLKGKLNNPLDVIKDIRNSKGNDKDEALLNFQGKIDGMSTKQLKTMRDELVNDMSSPKNNDDQLLGSLLNKVNKEIDSRGNSFNSIPNLVVPHGVPTMTKSMGENTGSHNHDIKQKLEDSINKLDIIKELK